jgi:Uma2 family endonuclease
MNTQLIPILTVDDLDALPDDGNKYELIEGEIYMSRAPSLKHQIAIHNMQMAIGSYLLRNPIGIVVPGPGVIFDQYNGVIPDIVYMSHERRREVASGDRLTGAPDLAIEVTSPGAENEKRDRKLKRRLYGRFRVKEYWIVDPETESIEVYYLRRRGLELVATCIGEDEIISSVLPGFRLQASEIFKS